MISNVYARYMAEFGIRPYSKYSSHKKRELHDIYSDIVKLNRLSPFYSIDTSEVAQQTAIDIKESARGLAEISDELTDATNPYTTYNTTAVSDMPEYVSVRYVGLDKPSDYSPVIDVTVEQLATPQTNTGIYMNPNRHSIPVGTYSFDVDISSITYELQFAVKESDTNRDVLNRIARLVNNSNIGINASIKNNDMGQCALSLSSKMTGVGSEPCIFNISDSGNNGNITDMLKLNSISHYPSNAVFTIDGQSLVSTSNEYTLDSEFAFSFNQVTPEDTHVGITLKADTEPVIESIHELVRNYNRLSLIAANGTSTGSQRLHDELVAIASNYDDVLNVVGITIEDNGCLKIDDNSLRQASDESSLLEKISKIDKFKNTVKNKANAVMLNPMAYINKTIISYKNPARPSSDPYTTSIYTGMMYNGYC